MDSVPRGSGAVGTPPVSSPPFTPLQDDVDVESRQGLDGKRPSSRGSGDRPPVSDCEWRGKKKKNEEHGT